MRGLHTSEWVQNIKCSYDPFVLLRFKRLHRAAKNKSRLQHKKVFCWGRSKNDFEIRRKPKKANLFYICPFFFSSSRLKKLYSKLYRWLRTRTLFQWSLLALPASLLIIWILALKCYVPRQMSQNKSLSASICSISLLHFQRPDTDSSWRDIWA